MCGPVYPSLSAGVDVDEQQPLHHVGVVQLKHTHTHTASHDPLIIILIIIITHTLQINQECGVQEVGGKICIGTNSLFFPEVFAPILGLQAAPPAGEQLKSDKRFAVF